MSATLAGAAGAATPMGARGGLRKRLRTAGKRAWRALHEIGLRCGVVILPKHYYVPVPDLHELRRNRPRWSGRSAMGGVAVDLDAQLRFLSETVAPYEPEYRGNRAFARAVAGAFGPGFGYVEAQALHGVIRGTRPARIVEIGSGISTFCMLEALARNAAEGHAGAVTCVEPYPSAWLRDAPVMLVERRVEDVDLALFDTLEAGDLIFVDSTHALRIGGDVLRIVLEILPRLRPGVNIHLHDIFLPFDYQRDADRSLFQWLETALLHAFLIGNRSVAIRACLSHLHYDRPDALRAIFPEYRPAANRDGLAAGATDDAATHFPSSIYLTVLSGAA